MTNIFMKMIQKEGAIVIMEATKLGTMVENDTGKPWASLFGKLTKFNTGFLGVLQNCLWVMVEPKVGMRELKRERFIYEGFLQMIEAQGGPPETPPDGIRRDLVTQEILMVMMAAVQVHFSMMDMDELKGSIKDWMSSKGEDIGEENIEENFKETLTSMGPLLFFILSASGLVSRLISGLADHRPVLEKYPGGPTAFRVSNAGKDILFI